MTRLGDGQSQLHATIADAYTRSHKHLRKVAFRYAAHDAEDLVHDAFVRALEGGHTLRHPAAATSWLHRILTNAGIDLRRRDRLRREHALSDSVESRSSRLPDIIAVRDAFHCLPYEDRRICLLFDVLGHTHAEIADVLQIPIGTSKRRLFSARRRLRAQLSTGSQNPKGLGATLDRTSNVTHDDPIG
jgi:RNA polymerase sigma-70 factor, ECF subfamily